MPAAAFFEYKLYLISLRHRPGAPYMNWNDDLPAEKMDLFDDDGSSKRSRFLCTTGEASHKFWKRVPFPKP